MKQCPTCHRRYNDETLNFCLDDGEPLLYGPKSEEPPTAVLPVTSLRNDAPTEIIGPPRISSENSNAVTQRDVERSLLHNKRALFAGITVAALLIALYIAYYSPFSANSDVEVAATADEPKAVPRIYWELDEAGKEEFIRQRAMHIQALIGDEPSDFDTDAIRTIKIEIDDYVNRKDSLSQKQFEEGLRVIYGRATQYAPLVIKSYETRRVPAALGLYQAMIESEYRDCPTSPFQNGPVGMFQFSRKTAARYDLMPADYCDVSKQADAAARYMSDLSSDFGEGRSNATLGLLSYAIGETGVRDCLRKLRGSGIVERSYWAILRNRKSVMPGQDLLPPPIPLVQRGLNYVPRFFAAAIIGETPAAFELSTPPLTTLKRAE